MVMVMILYFVYQEPFLVAADSARKSTLPAACFIVLYYTSCSAASAHATHLCTTSMVRLDW